MIRQIAVSVRLILLSLLAVAAGAFAVENIDCINYEGEIHPLCKFTRIETTKSFILYTMEEGVQVQKANGKPTNSLKNNDFYVYAPKAENDSLEFFLKPDTAVFDGMKVNSLDLGYREFSVKGLYPVYNILIGTSVTPTAEPALTVCYNFYAPEIEYCLDKDCKKKFDSASELKLEVGDSTTIFAHAVIPVGPDKGKTDTTLVKSFYFSTDGAAENLEFHNMSGRKLDKQKLGVQLDFAESSKGLVGFVVLATGRVDAKAGDAFVLRGYDAGTDEKGNTEFVVNSAFPGKLSITGRDMPRLDSAAVFDSDGDGVGDKITAWFSGDRDSVILDSYTYSWPDAKKFGAWEECRDVKNAACGLKEKMDFDNLNLSSSGNKAEGALKVAVTSQYTGDADTLKATLSDRIGPVIQTATIIRGEKDKDILVIKFNKDIDTSWTKGDGFILNGKKLYEKAIEKDGDEWRFSVDTGLVKVGDKISISLDGGIKAADGNETGPNKEVSIKSAGGIYLSDENNGFYDRNTDGTMDSASVGFLYPITEEDLETMALNLYWVDSKGDVLKIKLKSLDSLYKKGVITLSEDKTVMGIDLSSKKYDIKEMLTAIDPSYTSGNEEYGYAEVSNTISVAGHKDSVVTTKLPMDDRMAPVISSTFLSPESFQKTSPDVFTVSFSEPVDTTDFKLEEKDLLFLVDGKWSHYDLSAHNWMDDGKTLKIFMEAGRDLSERMNPADSMKFGRSEGSFTDLVGNSVSMDASPVMVEGDPRVIMQTTALASLERAVLLADKAAFTERFVEENVKMDDEMKKSLGVLLDVGFATILKGDTADGATLDLENIGLKWELDVFTNLGGYVANASGKILCNDKSFGENCFENPRKLYLRWNMRSNNGRKVGVGAYVAKLKVVVFGAKETFKVERIYSWGIRAGSDGLKLDD